MQNTELLERVNIILSEAKQKAIEQATANIGVPDLEAILTELAQKPQKQIVMADSKGHIKEPSSRSIRTKKPQSMVNEPKRHKLVEALMDRMANPDKQWSKAIRDAEITDQNYMWSYGRLAPHEIALRQVQKGEATRDYIEKWFGVRISVELATQ
jgi:2,3-bisphosphoglycerate-independent phosphoglycerate mutase